MPNRYTYRLYALEMWRRKSIFIFYIKPNYWFQASKSDGKQVETPQKNVKAIKDATSEAEHDKTSGTEKKKKVNLRFISFRTLSKNPVWNLEVIEKT